MKFGLLHPEVKGADRLLVRDLVGHALTSLRAGFVFMAPAWLERSSRPGDQYPSDSRPGVVLGRLQAQRQMRVALPGYG